MGRTYRRRKKKLKEHRPLSLSSDSDYLNLIKWLSCQRWEPNCKIAPVLFKDTGRGMVAKEMIEAHSVLASLPADLLITVETVAKSSLSPIFQDTSRSFSVQQILSAFLLWQKHLGASSSWLPYLSILPEQYYSPVFSSSQVIDCFPMYIRTKIERMKAKIDELYSVLIDALSNNVCDHCHQSYSSIFGYEEFKLAWFTVNSRSVYLSPTVNDSCGIRLSDSNSLALAPFLDMINHSDQAKVKVLFDENKRLYSIVTLVPYKKNEEVFINYGGHSNEKLYLEYGFVLPVNCNDSVAFSQDDILNALRPFYMSASKSRFNFLKSHGFFDNIYCGFDGLSWNARALIYALLEPATIGLGEIQRSIFSSSFALPKNDVMQPILQHLFAQKIEEYNRSVDALLALNNQEEQHSLTVEFGVQLMHKYLFILKKNLSV